MSTMADTQGSQTTRRSSFQGLPPIRPTPVMSFSPNIRFGTESSLASPEDAVSHPPTSLDAHQYLVRPTPAQPVITPDSLQHLWASSQTADSGSQRLQSYAVRPQLMNSSQNATSALHSVQPRLGPSQLSDHAGNPVQLSPPQNWSLEQSYLVKPLISTNRPRPSPSDPATRQSYLGYDKEAGEIGHTHSNTRHASDPEKSTPSSRSSSDVTSLTLPQHIHLPEHDRNAILTHPTAHESHLANINLQSQPAYVASDGVPLASDDLRQPVRLTHHTTLRSYSATSVAHLGAGIPGTYDTSMHRSSEPPASRLPMSSSHHHRSSGVSAKKRFSLARIFHRSSHSKSGDIPPSSDMPHERQAQRDQSPQFHARGHMQSDIKNQPTSTGPNERPNSVLIDDIRGGKYSSGGAFLSGLFGPRPSSRASSRTRASPSSGQASAPLSTQIYHGQRGPVHQQPVSDSENHLTQMIPPSALATLHSSPKAILRPELIHLNPLSQHPTGNTLPLHSVRVQQLSAGQPVSDDKLQGHMFPSIVRDSDGVPARASTSNPPNQLQTAGDTSTDVRRSTPVTSPVSPPVTPISQAHSRRVISPSQPDSNMSSSREPQPMNDRALNGLGGNQESADQAIAHEQLPSSRGSLTRTPEHMKCASDLRTVDMLANAVDLKSFEEQARVASAGPAKVSKQPDHPSDSAAVTNDDRPRPQTANTTPSSHPAFHGSHLNAQFHRLSIGQANYPTWTGRPNQFVPTNQAPFSIQMPPGFAQFQQPQPPQISSRQRSESFHGPIQYPLPGQIRLGQPIPGWSGQRYSLESPNSQNQAAHAQTAIQPHAGLAFPSEPVYEQVPIPPVYAPVYGDGRLDISPYHMLRGYGAPFYTAIPVQMAPSAPITQPGAVSVATQSFPKPVPAQFSVPRQRAATSTASPPSAPGSRMMSGKPPTFSTNSGPAVLSPSDSQPVAQSAAVHQFVSRPESTSHSIIRDGDQPQMSSALPASRAPSRHGTPEPSGRASLPSVLRQPPKPGASLGPPNNHVTSSSSPLSNQQCTTPTLSRNSSEASIVSSVHVSAPRTSQTQMPVPINTDPGDNAPRSIQSNEGQHPAPNLTEISRAVSPELVSQLPNVREGNINDTGSLNRSAPVLTSTKLDNPVIDQTSTTQNDTAGASPVGASSDSTKSSRTGTVSETHVHEIRDGKDSQSRAAANVPTAKGSPLPSATSPSKEVNREALLRDLEEKIPVFPTEPDMQVPGALTPANQLDSEDVPKMSATFYPGQDFWDPYTEGGWVSD